MPEFVVPGEDDASVFPEEFTPEKIRERRERREREYEELSKELEKLDARHQEWDYGALAIEVSAAKAEIEQLKAENEMMTEQAIKFRNMARDHAALLAYAADALEQENRLLLEPRIKEIIAELRMAVE